MRSRRLRDITGLTDIGRRRRDNEDAIAWDAQLGLALVADGVGGNNGGKVASSTAARSIKGDLQLALGASAQPAEGDDPKADVSMVLELVRRAHQRILAAGAREPKLRGMGATLALTLLTGDAVVVANVGDSRVYRLRQGNLEQLTQDHVLATELRERGELTEAQARGSAHASTLTRALGMTGELKVSVERHPVEQEDLYLLCSDGLTRAVSDEELSTLLAGYAGDLREAAQQAVALANRRGGRDNVSVVLLSVA